MESDSEKKPSNARKFVGSVCPACNSSDQVQRVSVVVDGGTSVLGGLTTSMNLVGPSGISVGGFAGVQASNLASRLQVQTSAASLKWTYVWLGGFAGWFIVGNLMFQSFSGSGVTSATYLLSAVIGGIGFFPGLAVGAIVGFIVRSVENKSLTDSNLAAERTQARLRASYYCLRDDIVFNNEIYGSPDEVSSEIFNQELS